MELNARAIHEKQFNDAWRGYNQEEVDDFLDRVAEAVETLRRENDSLRARIRELDQTVAASRDTEEMLKKTLVTAQQAAEEAIARAKAKADELIAAAGERARTTEEDARRRVAQAEEDARSKAAAEEARLAERRRDLDERITRLKTFEDDTKTRLRSFFHQQLKALEALTDVEPPRFAPPGGPRPVSSSPAAPAENRGPEAEEDRGVRDLFFRQGG
ncbi:MAG TPA: DivIVA domain-containing protein [Actinomycetota bacterium]|jgi:cell division initiation protein|nr:DivIVA domain-containing protein [Actinomycetota bacterium]